MDYNLRKARQFLDGFRSGQSPEDLARFFDDDLSLEIQGDEGVLPWIGRKTGRAAFPEFIRDLRNLTEQVMFEVEDILTSADRAAIVGALATRVKATGKVIESQFVIILTIRNEFITRFQMIEDSFRVSNAARQ